MKTKENDMAEKFGLPLKVCESCGKEYTQFNPRQRICRKCKQVKASKPKYFHIRGFLKYRG